MIVYSKQLTPRLRYITDFLGREIIGNPFELTDDVSVFQNYEGPKINYGSESIVNSELSIINCQLLFEKGIIDQNITCFEMKGLKAFFKTSGDFPFDIFAASFYLLSRYEEYLPHTKDEYGRYAHTNSIAFKEGFLDQPLINIWVDKFSEKLQRMP